MNESKKTLTFVGVACALSVCAAVSHFANQPGNSEDFALVGQPFFAEFESASQAKSLEVATIDSENAALKRFSVANKDGLWRIPSHYDYPAEAATRLAETASSVIGIERESQAGRLQEHERLGVIDPLGDDIEDPETVGKRITLKDGDGEVLVDYIIGKQAGSVEPVQGEDPFTQPGDENYYFVRKADENQVYKVKLNLDLSAKFSDWIDPDLLRVETDELTRINIDNYEIEEDRSNPLGMSQGLIKSQGDKVNLARSSSAETWKLTDLDEAREDLNLAGVTEVVSVLEELKIAGVRPKYKYKGHLLLTADLKLNDEPELKEDPQGLQQAAAQMQADLEQKGFSLAGGQDGLALVSQFGELELGTDKGVVYTLHVGKSLEGDEQEIEIGLGTEKSDSKIESDSKNESELSETSTDAKSESEENSEDTESGEATKEESKNRYMMIRVSFDDSLLGGKPVKPTEPTAPEKPASYEAAPETDEPKEEKKTDEDSKPETDDPAPKPESETRNPESIKYDEDLKAFEQAKIDYEIAISKFEDATTQHETKVSDGKKAVDELNQRFGDWFYVISADNLSKLKAERASVVTPKPKPEPQKIDGLPARPDISFPEIPGLNGSTSSGEGQATEADKPVDKPSKMDGESTTDLEKKETAKKEPAAEQPKSKESTKPEKSDTSADTKTEKGKAEKRVEENSNKDSQTYEKNKESDSQLNESGVGSETKSDAKSKTSDTDQNKSKKEDNS